MREKEVKGAQLGCLIASLVVVGLLFTTCTAALITSAVNEPPVPGSPEAPFPGQAPGAPPKPGSAERSYSCYTPENWVYDGFTCPPGGEGVTVTNAVDGDTVDLSDGRRVRLLGVDAPERGECGYEEATQFTASKSVGVAHQVLLYREPGVAKDPSGRELAYLDVGYGHFEDLGRALAIAGLAEPYVGGQANAAYERQIELNASSSRYSGPCPDPTPTPTYEPVPDYDYPNYDYPDPVPDGDDGESRFCRRHWYC